MIMRLGRAVWIILGICALAGLSCGTDKATEPPPDPEAFDVEAESYIVSHTTGGDPFGLAYCARASGQHVVTGLDNEGEWIEIVVSVPEAGLYDVNLRYQALRDRVIVVRLTADGCGGDEEPEFTLTEGDGVG
jgi:hypothetical protein